MDSYEASRTVFSRIQSLEPENASKIMGYLLIQDYGEKEMIRLAFGPENLLQNLILKAKTQLGLLTKPLTTTHTPSSPSPFNPISRPNPLSLSSSSSSSSSSRIVSNGYDLSNPPTPSSNTWPSSPSSGPALSYASVVNNRTSANTNSGSFSSSTLSSLPTAYNSTSDPFYEYPVQDNALYLSSSAKTDDLFDPRLDWASMAANPSDYDDLQKQSYSAPGLYFGSEDANSGFGCRPCLYYAKGFCKNGETCRFVHGDSTAEAFNTVGSPNNSLSEHEQCQELLRLNAAAQQQKLASASQFMAGASFPYDNKCLNLLMQRQIENQRSPTAAMMMGDDFHKFGRCRFDRNELSTINMGGVNPSSRQIYLTFPADSTFREEDVSGYFSIYGPVQDVRIPYQQKRMFGFVTFVYPDTVKLILAKGNPHFVCDSRVLVKPYKEKGKIVEKKQQQQQLESGDYPLSSSPSGHDYDHHHGGPRMFYNTQEMLLMKKLEERASFQQAIELHGRKLMNLQLMDLKNINHHRHDQFRRSLSCVSSIPSPSALSYSPNNQVHLVSSDKTEQEVSKENNDKSAATLLQNAGLDAKQQLELDLNPACNPINGSQDNSGNGKILAKTEESDLNESIEHNLPDSLFASPKKSANRTTAFSDASEESNEMAKTSLLSTSSINISSPKSVFTKCTGILLGMEPLECN
ncbi:zinc finger CCCH domain-containing protein 46-like isoform X2 [Humulus lupulus]|uniref:zinc finger CCCH domain-containing protein 46-like isoform X2 n=1 Tax=Humulus lupulus TaxID=3486 RepID=UPI002B40396C|nr:zinc finger CCCH domain-containing protein 46-like isoform X2 [Humulus lupulus]